LKTFPSSEYGVQWEALGRDRSRRKGSVGEPMCTKYISETNPDLYTAASTSQPTQKVKLILKYILIFFFLVL
jgi:hypothetical protein